MMRFLLCICIFILSGCSSHDADYYSHHPQAVFSALRTCTTEDPVSHISCQDLEGIAQTYRRLVGELQMNPQLFGQQIVQLQIKCAQKPLSEVESKNCRHELDMRLAVVKWLESPES